MKYITLGEYAAKKLVNLAYFGDSRVIKIVRDNKDNTLVVRLYNGDSITERTLKSDDLLEVR